MATEYKVLESATITEGDVCNVTCLPVARPQFQPERECAGERVSRGSDSGVGHTEVGEKELNLIQILPKQRTGADMSSTE